MVHKENRKLMRTEASMNVSWFEKSEMIDAVKKEIIPTRFVMDVGPGIKPQSFFVPLFQIIIEPFMPYIDRIRQNADCFSRNFYLCDTWDNVLPKFADKSVDSIFALDVIEHFTKSEGEAFITQAKRIARKQIVIFTPLGFYPQDYHENEIDRWGMNGGVWQAHKSGWMPEDFTDEWKVLACKDFHEVNQNENELGEPIGAFYAILNLDNSPAPMEDRLVMEEIRISEILKYSIKRKFSSILGKSKKNN